MGENNENVMIDSRAITTSIPTETAASTSTTNSTTVTPTESTSAATTISPRTTTSSTTVTPTRTTAASTGTTPTQMPTESTSAATTISPRTTSSSTVMPTESTIAPTGSTVTPTEATSAATTISPRTTSSSTVMPTESTIAPTGSTVTPTESTIAPTRTTTASTGTTPTQMPTGTTPTEMPTGTTPTMTATVSETPTGCTLTPTVTVSETPTGTGTTVTPTPTITVTDTTPKVTGTTPTDTPTETPTITSGVTTGGSFNPNGSETPVPTISETPTVTVTETPTVSETPTVTPEVRVTWVVYYPSGTVKTYSNESNESFSVYGADTYDTVICENCFYDITNGNYMVYRGYQSLFDEPRVITLCYKSTTAGPTETPTATETPTNSSTSTVTPDPSIPPVTDSSTTFKVNSKPTIIKYTGKQSISIKLGSIYSAASAYVVPRYYHKSNKFGVFTDNNTSTSDDFRYFNVMKTTDSNTAYSYNISLKTSPNLYPASNNETIAGTSNEIPTAYKYNYEKWTYTWNSVRINPRLINNGANGEIICTSIDSPVFEVRQKQNNITLPESHSISFYGNTTLKDYQVGPVIIEPINSYSDTVIAKITKVSSNNILSFSNGASSVSVKRGEQISVKRNTTSSSGWAYITITSGDTVLTPAFANPISYTCVVKLNYLGSKPGSSGGSGNNSGNNNGNNNDVVNPAPSGSDTTTPTPTQTPSDTPSASPSDGGSGTWLSVEGIIYDMTDDGAIHYLTGSGDIACGGSVRYEKLQSEVTTKMWYVHVYSKNSNAHLYTIIIGYQGSI